MGDKPKKTCIACGVKIITGSVYLGLSKSRGPFCLACYDDICDDIERDTKPPSNNNAIRDIIAQIEAVERKRGLQDKTAAEYLAVLIEEFLELTQAINNAIDDNGPVSDIRYEAIDVAQVAIDLIRCYDRNNWGRKI